MKNKEIRLTKHALKNITEREISNRVLNDCIINPDTKLFQKDNRFIYMKLYYDNILSEDMLLRVVIEEEETEMVVVTVYKTSKIEKYYKRGQE